MFVCGRVVSPPLIRFLVANDAKRPRTKQIGHTHKADVLPILADNDEDSVLLGILPVRILACHAPGVFHKGGQRLARTIAADDENFTRLAGVDRFLVWVRAIELQSFELPLP